MEIISNLLEFNTELYENYQIINYVYSYINNVLLLISALLA